MSGIKNEIIRNAKLYLDRFIKCLKESDYTVACELGWNRFIQKL